MERNNITDEMGDESWRGDRAFFVDVIGPMLTVNTSTSYETKQRSLLRCQATPRFSEAGTN
jgi:hypothetical protein